MDNENLRDFVRAYREECEILFAMMCEAIHLRETFDYRIFWYYYKKKIELLKILEESL